MRLTIGIRAMSAPVGGQSHTPHRRGRRQSPSPPRNRGRQLVVQRVVKEGGSVTYPTLTRTNYSDWAVLMRVNLQAQGLWEAVDTGDVPFHEDRQALSAILRAVPAEMLRPLAEKDNAKDAWDALKSMRVGADRVKQSRAQKLLQNFESMRFKSGESVEDFSLRLQGVVSNLRLLGEDVSEEKVVRKLLRVVPRRYRQMALSIETLIDLTTLSIEDLTGRLLTVDDHPDSDGEDAGQALFGEKEGTKWASKDGGQPSRNAGTRGSASGSRQHGHDGNGGDTKSRPSQPPGRDITKDKCRYCGKLGHWAKDCRKAKRDREKLAQANLLVVEPKQADGEEEPTLLMAQVCELSPVQEPEHVDGEIALNEEHALALLREEGEPVDPEWILDTGASNHMTGAHSAFSELDTSVRGFVKFGDASRVRIEGRGTVLFACKNGDHCALTGVYYIPRLRSNMVSLGQLDESRCKTVIEDGVLTLRDPQRKLLCRVRRGTGRLYVLQVDVAQPVCLAARGAEVAWTWHARFGHLNFDSLRALARRGLVRGMPELEHINQVCDGCLVGKQRRTPFPAETAYRAVERLDLVHGDICGPISPSTHGGKKYFLLLIDDLTRYMWLFLLATKSEAPSTIKRFKAGVEVETGCKLRVLRTDRGGEFTSVEFGLYCANEGVARHLTAPYSPQQNGVVERRNQTVVAMARCMMKAKDMPSAFWGEAVTTAVFILNRSPTKSVRDKTPFEAWHGRAPAVHFFKTFGCVVYVKDVKPHLKKLDDRSKAMVFLGYEPGSKAYRAYDPSTKRVCITRDAVFDETAKWDWAQCGESTAASPNDSFVVHYEAVGSSPPVAAPSSTTTSPAPTPTPPTATSTPTPPRGPGAPGVEFVSPPTTEPNVDEDHDVPRRFRTISNILDTSWPMELEADELYLVATEEPSSFEEAAHDERWRRAMQEEISSVMENNTWTLVDLPAGKRPIGLKWVFKVKKNESGEVVKYKARVVAKGYVQRQGIDFDEVFAPVARMDSVRLLLAVAAHAGWSVHHMDVKSAFLNGELDEEVYVSQPQGFVDDKHPQRVLRLNRALYGLRQAPRAWNAKLDASLHELGFKRSQTEHAMYTRGEGDDRLIVGVYVDDLIITGARDTEIRKFKEEMHSLFRMSDLGLLSYYLGIEVNQDKHGITINQAAYAQKILKIGGMAECNSACVPMETRLKLSKQSDRPPVDVTMYRSIVGSLRYLVHTRPDIAYAVGFVSRFMESPKDDHLAAVKHILRYIAGTLNYGCVLVNSGENGIPLLGFSDSDLAGDTDDRKSTSGVIFFLGSSPIAWQSQKQKVVALSSCEAEYISATSAACLGIWLARLLAEITGADPKKALLKVDNKSAISLCKNPVFHDRSKHIDTRYHFIRQCLEEKKVEVEFVRSDEQIADILTKPLGRNKFCDLRFKAGVVEISSRHQD